MISHVIICDMSSPSPNLHKLGLMHHSLFKNRILAGSKQTHLSLLHWLRTIVNTLCCCPGMLKVKDRLNGYLVAFIRNISVTDCPNVLYKQLSFTADIIFLLRVPMKVCLTVSNQKQNCAAVFHVMVTWNCFPELHYDDKCSLNTLVWSNSSMLNENLRCSYTVTHIF